MCRRVAQSPILSFRKFFTDKSGITILAILVLFSIDGIGDALHGRQDDPLLTTGAPVERELAGGQAHRYRLSLSQGAFIRVLVEQRGVDVVVALSGVDGTKYSEMDSPNGTSGPEVISFIART